MPGADLEANVQLTLHEVFAGPTRYLEIPQESGTSKSLDARIPKGVRDGERVRVKGKGLPGQNGGPAGDIQALRIGIVQSLLGLTEKPPRSRLGAISGLHSLK